MSDSPLQLDRLNAALGARYHIQRELGAGGMATVYLAEDLKHDRKVAIKVLKPELAAVLGAERFVVEIKTTAALSHPHILPLFDSGTADGFLFYVMPYIQGETIREKLNRETQFGVDEAVRIAREVADALDYAHRHGVIHRDIKPENILLHDGRAMVMDFGIALAVSAAAGGRMTETGLSLGTPHYMSPEQATAEKDITGRSDIYSLASVLYEMLAGQPPHLGGAAQQVIMKIITEHAQPVRQLRKNVPPNVDAALAMALEKLPADRFESAKAFGDALGNAGFTSASTAASPGSAGEKFGLRTRTFAIILVTAALAIIAAWEVGRGRRDTPGHAARFPLNSANGTRILTGSVAISPDGRIIVFAGERDNAIMLYARSIDDDIERPIPGTEGGAQPFFSPDGRWLAFMSRGTTLTKVQLAGGSVVPLAPASMGVRGGTWTKNDAIVLGTIQHPAQLLEVSANGGTLRPVALLDSSSTDQYRFPVALEDGKTVLLTHWRGAAASASLAAMSLDKGTTVPLDLPGAFEALGVFEGSLLYLTGGGALMAVPFDSRGLRPTGQPVPIEQNVAVGFLSASVAAVSASGSLIYQSGSQDAQLVIADLGGRTKLVTADIKTFSFPRFSPDGKRLAVGVATHGVPDIWIYDLASASQVRLTAEGFNDRPEWTADGKRVAYYAQGHPNQQLSSVWWQAADGSGAAEPLLTNPGSGVNEVAFSRDGKALVYRLNGGTHAEDLYYRLLNGDTASKEIAATSFLEHAPRISPDGKWVAYSSNQSGQFEIDVQPLPALGARFAVSVGGGTMPVWAPDGRRIYYVSNSRLQAANVTMSPAFTVTSRQTILEGNFLFSTTVHAWYDVAPDGQHFVLIKPVAAGSQTIVVHDWKYTLRERIARGAGK